MDHKSVLDSWCKVGKWLSIEGGIAPVCRSSIIPYFILQAQPSHARISSGYDLAFPQPVFADLLRTILRDTWDYSSVMGIPLLGIFAVLRLCVLLVNGITPDPPQGHWVDTWASMPQLAETENLPPGPFTQPTVVFNDATIRQTLHLSTGAKQIRIRFSNAFGTTDLPVTAAAVALSADNKPGSSAIISWSVQNITFSGNSSIIIPNGSLAVSDPIALEVKPQTMITVDLYLANGQQSNDITSHPGSRTTSWFSPGNHIGVQDLAGGSTLNADHWYFVSAVEAWSPPETRSLVVAGDSITDGHGSTTNGNDRWPDQLLARTQANASTSNIAVVNQAAGGNRILADEAGPNAIGRIDRDVLSHPGVGYVVIYEGVNDIGTGVPNAADRLIQAYQQIITRVHTSGLPIFGATITPFFGNGYFTTENEAVRTRVNEWIRSSGKFDAVIDFDAATRDPSNGQRLNPAFDVGDGLHLNPGGYKAMAEAFDLSLFEKFASGVSGFQ
ncbi:extracellular gdsl-like lipase [Moniliophthora roreri MCA 2997]|uniref:Extracellular gdsl-like lipase n=1 Tax=Moniliophthora roreri (strain MCA 2997) TaxID=1381753 RepID=V2YJX7_MONRO|nr:extracellular gdsl-like lipase [Moniliophthora roreri MCA 2997]